MPSSRSLNALTARKRLIIARSDLHRQLLEVERERCGMRGGSAHGHLDRHRWWLLAGAVAGGVLVARRWRNFAAWIPGALAVWRAFRR